MASHDPEHEAAEQKAPAYSVPLRGSGSRDFPTRITVEPTPDNQRIYNKIRQTYERLRQQTHLTSQQNLVPPSAAPSTSTVKSPILDEPVAPPPQDEISRNQDLPKRPRGRRSEPPATDTRLNTAVKRKLKLACPHHRAKKVICNCHDFSKLEEGYQNFLHQRTNSPDDYNEALDLDVDILPTAYSTTPIPLTLLNVFPQRPLDSETHGAFGSDSSVTDSLPAASDSGYGSMSQHRKVPIDLPSSDQKLLDQDQACPSELASGETHMENYISIVAEDLLNKVGAKELDVQTVDRLSSILPALLQALALNLGHKPLSEVLRNMTVFVYTHRDAIATSFREYHHQTTELGPKSTSVHRSLPTEAVNGCSATPEKAETDPEEYRLHLFTDGFDEEIDMPGLEIFKKLIFEDPSYTWLLHRLRAEVACSRAEPDSSRDIREAILRSVTPLTHISRSNGLRSVKVIYTIDWDVLGFLQSQDYSIPNSEAIANAITLTGSHTDAQALSCHQYMAQIWPLTGVQTLRLMQELLEAGGKRKELSFDTPSRLTLVAWIKGRSVVVSALGVPDFVAEIGEQLAWLGSTLRTSPVDVGTALCTPYVNLADYRSGSPRETPCYIKFRVETSEARSRNENGQCWHNLFANPVVAQGFPIPKRSENDMGLEMPLDMLVVLVRARYIDTFNSKTFIKGFSTMLVPTKQSEDLLIWHLLYNEDPNERISYLDCGLKHIDVQIPHLEQCRHILGWCSSAISIVGTAAASYKVGNSRLPKAHSGCFLEKVEISGGQFVTGTAAFAVGRREKPVSISRFGYYVKKIQWITTKYFIFWDEEEKRGWLVNGASSLLHILRASLAYSKDKFGSEWSPDCLLDMANQSAYDVLTNPKIRHVKLYLDRTDAFDEEIRSAEGSSRGERSVAKHYTVEDEVEHVYNILEKLIDHQAMAEQQPGFEINVWPRRQLEGWDFNDLITGGDPFFGRVADLHALGKGWVDFTRTIRAVTLLGRGFGELIKPQFTTAPLCHRWSSLPSRRYYLAALVSDLKEIMERHGNPASNPRELCHNVTLNMNDAIFDPCPCTQGKDECRDAVQTLFPMNFFIRKFKPKSQIALEDGGAVIFGHNMDLHWQWRDSGDPVKGNPPRPDIDSGIGSSINSSSSQSPSESNISAAGSNVQPPDSRETPRRRLMKKSKHRYLSELFGRSTKKPGPNMPDHHSPSPPP